MPVNFQSDVHVFNVEDITTTFDGQTIADSLVQIDLAGAVMTPFTDKDGDVLYGIDNEFGFHVTDFIGAEAKTLDGDFAEGFAGNILNEADPTIIEGIAIRNAVTDVFKSGGPFGTWSLGLGGATVKASTEHYASMAAVLSDQAFPGDPDALGPLDDDLRLRDLRPTGVDGAYEPTDRHDLWVTEMTEALQAAIDNVTVNGPSAIDVVLNDIDFDRDGVDDTYRITTVTKDFDANGDGTITSNVVGAVDLGNNGSVDLEDKFLNGFGTDADVTDLLDPNESTTTFDIAYGNDYSVSLKDDGKLLFRFGEAVKRPNDIRMDIKLDLPDEWTEDLDSNGVADSLENGRDGFVVVRAELIINHDITNNPNDQVRPEDYENEAAIGRLPSHYIIEDPEDASNTLWVSTVDSFNSEGDALPSYLALDDNGDIDPWAGGTAVYDPEGSFVGWRNTDGEGNPIGTVYRDLSLVDAAEAAGLTFTSSDLSGGFTNAWYTTVDREPFEWSYDKFSDNPYKNVFESFRSREEAEDAGYTDADLESGPRWRLTPNKFGQDLPGVEVPLEENTSPPYQRDNIKYPTGETTVTKLNLLDWEGESPLQNSKGWMFVDPERLDENGDGVIDGGWLEVTDINGTVLNEGDAMPTDPILSAVTPNGMNLTHEFFDTAVYVKGDRQDSAKLYDIQLEIEYAGLETIGAVQQVTGLTSGAQVVAFQDGATFEDAVVFATTPTRTGPDPASVTFNQIGDTAVVMQMEEPDYLDGYHVKEDVSLLTFEEGTWTLQDGTRLEVGTTDVAAGSTNTSYSVDFETAFDEAPVVMVQIQSDNGLDWKIARAFDVDADGFQFKIQEEEASDQQHAAETVGWFAIDPDEASGLIDWGNVDAQAFTGSLDHTATPFVLDEAVGLNPLLQTGTTTFNGPDPYMMRLLDLSDDGSVATAELRLQEELSNDLEAWHTMEDLNGLAFSDAGLLTGYSELDTLIL